MPELKDQVEQALEEIRPFLVKDGGNISLVAIEGDTVIVELEGNCISCSVNQMTLQLGVETTIKKYAPQIKKVVKVNVVFYRLNISYSKINILVH